MKTKYDKEKLQNMLHYIFFTLFFYTFVLPYPKKFRQVDKTNDPIVT